MYIVLLFVYFFCYINNNYYTLIINNYFQNFFGNLLLAELFFFHPYCQKYWLGKVVDLFALVLFCQKVHSSSLLFCKKSLCKLVKSTENCQLHSKKIIRV